MIDKATAQRIKDTADIVDVVSDYVHLVRRGSNYMGLCPFHNERTPSFSVNKARNFCYCFSCHKGGSPVNFLMEKEGISYREALLQLAKKYGIKVEEREISDEERERQSRRESFFVANEWAMLHFENNLHNTDDGKNIGLSYLYGRDVTYEAVKAFHLGYALDKWDDYSKAAEKKGIRSDILQQLGLIKKSEKGNFYDVYRGRVIFPILNTSGKVVGFGGRDLKGGPAKYINSPESEIYKKSFELYGIYQARQSMQRENECFLVEGYLDVIGMWQSGMKNVVASSGTALTDGQISLIKRFTKNVTLIYDGDKAGIKAALRGVDMLLAQEMDVNVLLLPDGMDPDEFARKHSPEEFREFVRTNKTDVVHFKANVLMSDARGDSRKRYEAIESILTSLAHIPDKMKRLIYVQDCSAIMGVPEEEIAKAVAQRRYRVVAQLRASRQMELQRVNALPAPGPEPALQQPSGSLSANIPETQQPLPAAPESDRSMIANKELLNIGRTTNPLLPLEWKVLQYCIRYGFLDFCAVSEEEMPENSGDQARMMTVLEYVDEDLENDGISFSVKEFADTFALIRDMFPSFQKDAEAYREQVAEGMNERRLEGYKSIGDQNLSSERIALAEQKLEEDIALWASQQMEEFAKGYVAKELASHEDATIRFLTTEALRERHQLSQIYSRERPAEKEEDKLLTLVPTALTVWKNGILDSRLNDLFDRFRTVAGKGNTQEEHEIQLKLAELIKLRSAVAKNIGDRILSPAKGRTISITVGAR